MKRFVGAMILMLWPLVAAAQYFPDYESTTVNDFAGILPDENEAALSAQLHALKSETGVEMTVVTLSRKDTYAPNISMEEFATGLFNEWGVGDKIANNGIMVLVLYADREMRIELGSGYDSAWNSVAAQVIDRRFLPAFQQNDYIGGIMAGVTDTIDTIARPAAANQDPPVNNGGTIWLVISALIAGWVVFQNKIKAVFARLKPCPSCNARGGLRVSRTVIKPSAKRDDGSGEQTTACTKCGYSASSTYVIGQKSRNDGKGGSFGGGSSSGGGASGKW